MESYKIIFLFIITFLLSSELCETTARHFYENRVINKKTNPKVYDISHRFLPDYSDNKNIILLKDVFTLVSSLSPFLIIRNGSAFKDYLSYYIVIILIRCVFINSTILPKTKHCHVKSYIDMSNSCYDKIFSGHFTTLFLATLIFYKYSIITNVYVLIIMNVVNALLILMTRSHYTVDIMVALITTLLVFTNEIKIQL